MGDNWLSKFTFREINSVLLWRNPKSRICDTVKRLESHAQILQYSKLNSVDSAAPSELSVMPPLYPQEIKEKMRAEGSF